MTAGNKSPLPPGEGQGEGSILSASTLLTDNLPLLAGAPNGIKKLRELILELAVRGKLVEQDVSDEPASELLKRIAVEKARLVAEGKIKKQKPLADSVERVPPADLPESWAWSSLNEVALVNPRNSAEDSLPVSFVPMTLIGVRFDSAHSQEQRLWSEVKQGFTHFAEGDIGVAKITPCFENSKACVFSNLTNGLGAGTTELHIVRPINGTIDPRYVLAYLKSPQFLTVGETKMTGTAGQKRLPKDFVEANPFPLPPLAEQHRIVAKVDELMALCDRLEVQQTDAASAHAQLVQALLGSLTQASDATEFAANWQRLAEHFHTLFNTEPSIDALKQTLLQLAVMGKLVPQDPSDEPASELLKRIQTEKQRLLVEGKSRKQKELLSENIPLPPYGVPSGWEWEILDSILYITGGVTLGRKLAGRKMVSKPYLRVANVQRGHLALDVMKEVEVPEDEVSKYLLKNSDLLITEGGDWDKVGRTAVWRDELPECLHQNHVFRARALTDEFESRWAEMYLNSTTARDYFAGSSKQTTNLASINMTQLRACAFPVPPLAEQHRIVAKADELMALCDQLKTQLSQARQLNEQLASTLVEQAVA
ncbi:type I restriction enzyme, S subunit [Pseudomonas pohangensis]|uniref:Type I restriction enzyme, S subunit n=1 Tax=Pseudomonas pohangensis TaxID=364197 RepID=A0A1H2DUI9_9PSED|nr:restriction endonuclease subunit S [Pseudomonas pohangensis]SDT86516.1 type I restriction enzyme, S subunit [Pseudomonas pohangensis]